MCECGVSNWRESGKGERSSGIRGSHIQTNIKTQTYGGRNGSVQHTSHGKVLFTLPVTGRCEIIAQYVLIY